MEDSVDPWDEPADATDPQPAELAASSPVAEPERPSGDLLVDSGTTGDDEVTAAAEEAPASDAVAPEQTAPTPTDPEESEHKQPEQEPAAGPTAAPTGFIGDAALLDEPDPWD